MGRVLLALPILALAACGHGSAPPPPAATPHATPPSVEAQPAGGDDLVVARVDGRPVYASCVRAQAAALGLDVDAALDQCVSFELLAGAAEAGGLRADPEVAESWRRELVRAVIRQDLGAIQTLDDLPGYFIQPILAKQGQYLSMPAIRVSHYVRAIVPKQAVVNGPEDRAAQAVADAIYAELGPRDGLLIDDLKAAGERAAAGTDVKIETTDPAEPYATPENEDAHLRLAVRPYREALYAIPQMGRVAPPVRTPWGWDVIEWWNTWPPTDKTASFFEAMRQRYFKVWTGEVARAAGIVPEVDDELFAQLTEAE
jgi:hypothetical protein